MLHLQNTFRKSEESGLLAVGVRRSVVESWDFLFVLGPGAAVSHGGHQLRETKKNEKYRSLGQTIIDQKGRNQVNQKIR